MQKTKHGAQKATPLISCTIGVSATMLVALLQTLVGALCIFNEYFSIKAMSVISAIVQFLSVFIGCLITGKTTYDKHILCCFITAGIVVFMFIGAAILLFDGVSTGVLAGLIATLSGLMAAIFAVMKKKKPSARRTNRKRSR